MSSLPSLPSLSDEELKKAKCEIIKNLKNVRNEIKYRKVETRINRHINFLKNYKLKCESEIQSETLLHLAKSFAAGFLDDKNRRANLIKKSEALEEVPINHPTLKLCGYYSMSRIIKYWVFAENDFKFPIPDVLQDIIVSYLIPDNSNLGQIIKFFYYDKKFRISYGCPTEINCYSIPNIVKDVWYLENMEPMMMLCDMFGLAVYDKKKVNLHRSMLQNERSELNFGYIDADEFYNYKIQREHILEVEDGLSIRKIILVYYCFMMPVFDLFLPEWVSKYCPEKLHKEFP